MPKKKRYRYPRPRVGPAIILKQRVADGSATPAEAQECKRILNVLRQKFLNGSLSPESARRFGFE